MLIELHMLKNYGPSNLNRDESGSPKSCVFGGVPRGRISSQCVKRNIRISKHLRDSLEDSLFGIRTRRMPEEVGGILKKRGVSENAVNAAMKLLTGLGNKDNKENDKGNITAQVMFFSKEELSKIADILEEKIKACPSENEIKKIKAKDIAEALKDMKIKPQTLDIAMFGRMITDNAFANVDASVQVAHAISTNKFEREFDYFTAVDDILDDNNGDEAEKTGAGMVGDTEFNSNCYYFYCAIDTDSLKENLNDLQGNDEVVNKSIAAFTKAFAFTNPTGKQNSFAAHALPSLVCVNIKEKSKIPVHLADAFLKPARYSEEMTLVQDSGKKLAEHIDELDKKFGDTKPDKRLWFSYGIGDAPKQAQICNTFEELIKSLEETL